VESVRQAINNGATVDLHARVPLLSSYRAAVLEKKDEDMFVGLQTSEKDPRKSLRIREVPIPALAPDE